MKLYLHNKEIKKKARSLLQTAVKARKIIRPCRCEICQYSKAQLFNEREGQSDRFNWEEKRRYPLSAHHLNYYKPYDVWWLCDFCHTTLHRAQLKFNFVCVKLPYAKEVVFNFVAWGNKSGYEDFLTNEIEWVRKELFNIERKKERLKIYLSRLEMESL